MGDGLLSKTYKKPLNLNSHDCENYNLKDSPLLVFDFWNCSPHLETSIEITLQHAKTKPVHYCFLGLAFDFNEIYITDNNGYGRELLYIHKLKAHKNISVHYPTSKLNIYSEKFQEFHFDHQVDYQTLFTLYYEGFPLGKLILSNLIDKFKISNPDIPGLLNVINDMITTYISLRVWADNFLRSHEGNVCIFNGRYLLPAAISHSANYFNRNVMYHDRGGDPNRYIYSARPVQCIQTRIRHHNQIWENKEISDDEAYNHGLSEFKLKRNRQNRNWYSFAENQTIGNLPQIPISKKVIVYFGGSSHEVRSYLDESIFPPGPWPDQFSLLSDICGIISQYPETFLIIRVHPHVQNCSKDEQSRWSRLSVPSNAAIVAHDSDIDSYALLDRADMIIVESSSMGLEAIASNKPTIICGTTPYIGTLNEQHKIQSYNKLEESIKCFPEVSVEQLNKCLQFQYCESQLGILYHHAVINSLFDASIKF